MTFKPFLCTYIYYYIVIIRIISQDLWFLFKEKCWALCFEKKINKKMEMHYIIIKVNVNKEGALNHS